MPSERTLKLVEFGYWVTAVTVLIVATTVFLGYGVGGNLVAVKYALFLAGVTLFGVGSLAIQPSSPPQTLADATSGSGGGTSNQPAVHPEEQGLTAHMPDVSSLEDPGEHRLETWLQNIPPLRNQALRLDQRVDRSVKLFVTGILVLATSAIMEFALNIGV